MNKANLSKIAAIYVRVSTLDQAQGASPEEQEFDCKKIAESKGLTVLNIYRDIEKYKVGKKMVNPSGKYSDRPQFKQMLKDGYDEKYGNIIVWREDRLYRGITIATVDFIKLVEDKKINVEIVNGYFDVNMAGGMAWAAGIELKAKKERLLMGGRARLKTGKLWNLPKRPFGYKYDPQKGNMDIVPEEAHVINQIWGWFGSGISTNQIRQKLLAVNAPQGDDNPSRKYLWANRRILNLLDYDTYFTGIHKIKWGDEIYELEFPKIITNQNIFDNVKRRKSNYKSYRNGATKFPTLTAGLVYCHADGIRLLNSGGRGGFTRKDGTKVRYTYLRCENNKNKYAQPGCCKNIKAEMLDKLVWSRLWDALSSGEKLLTEADKKLQRWANDENLAFEDKSYIEKQLEELFIQREQVISLFSKRKIVEQDLDIQLERISLEENLLRNQLNDINLASNKDRIEKLRNFCKLIPQLVIELNKELAETPTSEEDIQDLFDFKKFIIQMFVKRIDVFEDHSFSILTEIKYDQGMRLFIDQNGNNFLTAAPA